MNREDVILIFLCFFHFWRFQAPWWSNSEINNARKKPVGYVKRHIMTYLHIKNYGPKIHGLGRIGKNVSILGTFCWLAWEQKWPPIGHFESGNLLFWWVSRHRSLTYLCYILATHFWWLLKFSPNYVKYHNFEIQNGRRFWGSGAPGVKMVDAPRLPMGGFLLMRNTLWGHISYRLWVIGQNVWFFGEIWCTSDNKDGRRSVIVNPMT